MPHEHPSKKHELALTHAPNVDPVWSDAFILEARLQDLTGAQIGDALAEIDSHVVDSGEDPHEAFGDPADYARSVAATGGRAEDGGLASVVLPALLQTLGMIAVLNALRPAADGQPFELSVGLLATAGLLVVVFGLLAGFASKVVRFVIEHRVVSVVAFVLVIAGLVATQLIPGVVAEVPALWVVVGGIVVIVAGTLLGLLRLRSTEDPVESPYGIELPRRGSAVLPTLIIPIFTVVLTPVFLLL